MGDNSIIHKFKQDLEAIGCQMAEEKSGFILKGDGKFKKSKFLGIETDGKIFKSKTRNGTEVIFKSPITPEAYEKMSSYLSITPSQSKVIDWIKEVSKDKVKGLEFAAKKGFLSNIIAISFNPSMETFDSRGISGQMNKLDKIALSKGYAKEILKNLNISQKDDIKIYSTYGTLKLMKLLRRVKLGKGFLKF